MSLELICAGANKGHLSNQSEDTEVEIDGRTSDAIAIGLRASCPVFTYEHILSSAGIQLEEEMIEAEKVTEEEEDSETETVDEKSSLGAQSIDDLEKLLQEAIDGEDYERASAIRDELNKRG